MLCFLIQGLSRYLIRIPICLTYKSGENFVNRHIKIVILLQRHYKYIQGSCFTFPESGKEPNIFFSASFCHWLLRERCHFSGTSLESYSYYLNNRQILSISTRENGLPLLDIWVSLFRFFCIRGCWFYPSIYGMLHEVKSKIGFVFRLCKDLRKRHCIS